MDLDILLAAIGGVSAIVGIIQFLRSAGNSRLMSLLLIVAGGFALYYFIKESKEKRTIITPPSTHKRIDDPANKDTPIVTAGAVVKIPANPKIADVINRSASAEFAVLAMTNGKKDNQLAAVFTDWLNKHGSTSNAVLLNSFIDKGFFDKVMGGNSSEIMKTNAKVAAKYVCIINSSIEYSNSAVSDDLVKANGKYDVMLVKSENGKIIYSISDHSESASAISNTAAKQRAEEFLSAFFVKAKLIF